MDHWWEPFRDRGEYLLSVITDDTCGKGALLRYSLENRVDSELNSHGFLLTGARGCGKHNSAAIAASFLQDQRGYDVLFLSQSELCRNGSAEAKEKLDALFAYHEENSRALCLVIDIDGGDSERSALLNYLTQKLVTCRLAGMKGQDDTANEPSVFLILIAEQERDIPSLMRSMLFLCHFPYPDREMRLKLIASRGADVSDDYISSQELADMTQGLDYARLIDLFEYMRALIIAYERESKESLLPGELRAFLKSQEPKPDEVNVRRGRLIDKAEKLMDQLPALFAERAKASQSDTVPIRPTGIPQAAISGTETNVSDFRLRLQNMPVRDLLVTILGEERADHFRSDLDARFSIAAASQQREQYELN